MARGGPPQPGTFPASEPSAGGPGSHAPGEGQGEAGAEDPGGQAVGPRGSDASTPAGSAEGAKRAKARESGAGAARAGRGGLLWLDDYSSAAGDRSGDKWTLKAGGGAATPRHDREDRWGGGHGRHNDPWDGCAWPVAGPGEGRGHTATGHDGPVWTADGGQGHGGDASDDRCWGRGHRRGDGGYPVGGASSAAGPHPAR